MSTNRFTKFLLIGLVIASALVTMSSLAFKGKAAGADRSFDAADLARLSRYKASASQDLSYGQVEKVRSSRYVDSTWNAVEQLRVERSLLIADRSYDSIEAIRSLRSFK